jgi:hypothetical protein
MVFLWLNSRGKFMFLHCVALDRAEVVEPWHRWTRQGNSLFLFRLVLSLIATVLTLPLGLIAVISIFKMIIYEQVIVAAIIKAAALILTVLLIAIIFSIIKKLTMDFVVPIMFLRNKRCLESWREFSALLSGYFGEFVLYFLFQIVMGIAIGAIVLMIVLITCCCAGCLMLLPYLGTVLLLPVLIFKRAYSLYFLAQFGRHYDAFAPMNVSPSNPLPNVPPAI